MLHFLSLLIQTSQYFYYFSVKDRVDAPEFVDLPESITTLTGSNVTFACKVSGKPVPKITWKKGKKSLKESKTITVSTTELAASQEVVSELQLENVDPAKSEDIYTIEASNKGGEITHDVQLIGRYTLLTQRWPLFNAPISQLLTIFACSFQ